MHSRVSGGFAGRAALRQTPTSGLSSTFPFAWAGATEDGWIIVAVHDSKESWERFRDEKLVPGLPKVENGLQGQPDETTFEVNNVQAT